jgi:hypothetical protein
MRDCLYTKIISALFGLGLLSCTYSANAQSSVATDSSALHIQNIKKGHIIFVLPSQLNKLTELYLNEGKKVHLKHLSSDCRQLLKNAEKIIEVNVIEDPTYKVMDDKV